MTDCPKCKAATMQVVAPEVFQCAACNARVAFGEIMPRVVVQPYENDRRLVVVTIFDQNVRTGEGAEPAAEPVQIVIDRGLAKMFASALFSMTGDAR